MGSDRGSLKEIAIHYHGRSKEVGEADHRIAELLAMHTYKGNRQASLAVV